MAIREGLVILCEVKTGSGILNENEEAFLVRYEGPWCVVRTADEVHRIAEYMRRQLFVKHTEAVRGGKGLSLEQMLWRCKAFARAKAMEEINGKS